MKEGTKVRIDTQKVYDTEKLLKEAGTFDTDFMIFHDKLDAYIKENNVTELFGTVKKQAYDVKHCDCPDCKARREKWGDSSLIQIDLDASVVEFGCKEYDKEAQEAKYDRIQKEIDAGADPLKYLFESMQEPPHTLHEQCQFMLDSTFMVVEEV